MPGGGRKPISSEQEAQKLCHDSLRGDREASGRWPCQLLTCLSCSCILGGAVSQAFLQRQTQLQCKPLLGGCGYRLGCRHHDRTIPLQYHVHPLPNLSEGGQLSEQSRDGPPLPAEACPEPPGCHRCLPPTLLAAQLCSSEIFLLPSDTMRLLFMNFKNSRKKPHFTDSKQTHKTETQGSSRTWPRSHSRSVAVPVLEARPPSLVSSAQASSGSIMVNGPSARHWESTEY